MTTDPGLQVGSYEIDTAGTPMSMDISINSGDKKGQQRLGSFKLLKDRRLLIVFATNEEHRPSRFVPDATGESILAVYQRVR